MKIGEFKHSPESIQKMRLAHLGKRLTEKQKEKISTALKGIKRSDATKEKIRNVLKGHTVSNETRSKISNTLMGKLVGTNNPFYGKKHSKETRTKISRILKVKTKGEGNGFFGKKHTEEAKVKIAYWHLKNPLKGEFHPRWIMDRSLLSKCDEQRNSPAHREWSKQVKNRDYWKCQISNDDCSGRVEAHHILGWKSYPELRYQIKNGITLCHFHHPRKRVDEERYAADFQKLVAAKMQ